MFATNVGYYETSGIFHRWLDFKILTKWYDEHVIKTQTEAIHKLENGFEGFLRDFATCLCNVELNPKVLVFLDILINTFIRNYVWKISRRSNKINGKKKRSLWLTWNPLRPNLTRGNLKFFTANLKFFFSFSLLKVFNEKYLTNEGDLNIHCYKYLEVCSLFKSIG